MTLEEKVEKSNKISFIKDEWNYERKLEEVPKEDFYNKGAHLSYKGGRFFDADKETFEILNWYYSKDKDNIYFEWIKIKTEFNYESFEVIEWIFVKDKSNIYYWRGWKLLPIQEVDFKTFEVLDNRYSKDKNNIYFFGKKMEWVDVETFEVLNDLFCRDKNNVYLGILKIDRVDLKT